MYGTSRPQNDQKPWKFLRIHNYMALEKSGLFCDTYFIVDRVQRLFWSEEYMPPSDYGTPILGKLPVEYILQLKKLKEIREALNNIPN